MKRDKLSYYICSLRYTHACKCTLYMQKKLFRVDAYKGVCPHTKYVIQYNSCLSICISEFNVVLQPKLNYIYLCRII